tara:strand:- start:41186 stop:41398 length:213 start_codon:yes stop_codon:yes gene_type:complete
MSSCQLGGECVVEQLLKKALQRAHDGQRQTLQPVGQQSWLLPLLLAPVADVTSRRVPYTMLDVQTRDEMM